MHSPMRLHFLSCFILFQNRLFCFVLFSVEVGCSSVCAPWSFNCCAQTNSQALNGSSSLTHCLSPATGVEMPALGMSGPWALGLGFPRPLIKGLASTLIIGYAKTVPPLFSIAIATTCLHSFVLFSCLVIFFFFFLSKCVAAVPLPP